MQRIALAVVLCAVAASAAPALIWTSAGGAASESFALASRLDVPALVSTLANGAAVSNTELSGLSLSLAAGDALFLFTETDLTTAKLAARDAVVSTKHAEAPYTYGMKESDIAAVATARACTAAEVAALSLDSSKINVVAVCADASNAATMISAATAKATSWVAIYATKQVATSDTMPEVVEVVEATTSSSTDDDTATIWTGGFLAAGFISSILIFIALWGVCLNLSMQSQADGIDVPKIKQL